MRQILSFCSFVELKFSKSEGTVTVSYFSQQENRITLRTRKCMKLRSVNCFLKNIALSVAYCPSLNKKIEKKLHFIFEPEKNYLVNQLSM